MSIHVSYNQPDNEIHSYDGKPSAVVTGAGPAVIEIHMTAGEWDAANRLYYRQEATGVDGFVQASENNNQQFLLPCAYLASGELQIALNNPEQGLTTNLMKISITKMSSSGDLSDDDPQFTIDGKKRLVLVPGSQGILAVQFDNESESVTFKFPRYQDGVDLRTKTPYVNYRLPSSGELGKALCSIDTDMLTAEYIYFSWTIDINVTMFEGSIKFQVEFSDSQGYRWQSQIAELPILTSLYNTGLEPYSPSFLEEALRQMQQYSSDSEAFAAGTRNGVPVAEGDPAYHKNALYLSDWFFERSVKPEAKEALLFLLEHVAYTDTHGEQYLQNLRDELYDTAEVVGIAATFVQDGTVYDTDSLDSLKPMLTVLATYSDLSVREVTGYTLSGTLTEGTSTITVSYGGKTATFDVTVSSFYLNDILTLDGIKNTRTGHNASATTWEDLSGNQNDFGKQSAANAVVWGDDCAQFDATNRILGIDKNLLSGATALTIELVTKATGPGSYQSGSDYMGVVFTNREWLENNNGFRANSYKDATSLGISSQYAGQNVGWSSSNNVIVYIAWVFTGTQIIRYVNGESKATYTKTFPFGNTLSTWRIGGPAGSAQTYYKGNVYRIGMSAKAMTAEEIAERYAFFASRFSMA